MDLRDHRPCPYGFNCYREHCWNEHPDNHWKKVVDNFFEVLQYKLDKNVQTTVRTNAREVTQRAVEYSKLARGHRRRRHQSYMNI